MKTFPIGGVHPSENKLSGAKPIEVLPLPDVVTIPLAQHIGAPAVAKVAKGDKVVTGSSSPRRAALCRPTFTPRFRGR